MPTDLELQYIYTKAKDISKKNWVINQLYQKYGQHSIQTGLYMGVESQVIEEIVQDVFAIKVVKALEKGSPIENVKAWLSTIVRNMCLDYHRSQKKVYERGIELNENHEDRSLSDTFSDAQEMNILMLAVNLLKQQEKFVWVAIKLRKWSYDFLEKESKLDYNTIKTNVQTATRQLKKKCLKAINYMTSLEVNEYEQHRSYKEVLTLAKVEEDKDTDETILLRPVLGLLQPDDKVVIQFINACNHRQKLAAIAEVQVEKRQSITDSLQKMILGRRELLKVIYQKVDA